MIERNALVEQLRASTLEWIETVRLIPPAVFNQAESGGWSPAQVLMHMVLTEKGVNGILMGSADPAPPDRKPMFEIIERGLTNYEQKISAPSFLVPRPETYDPANLLQKFKRNRDAFEEILLNSPELDHVFHYPHPFFGTLTGMEWAYNMVLHASRHFAQLKRVAHLS